MNALEVDLKGLRQLVERRGKSFVILELVQNCWDEDGVTEVVVTLERIKGTPNATLRIVDDAPEGFHDLRHAYTLFAASRKKDNAEKRGRFNLGEKLVIALADRFTVRTTTGGVEIDVKKDERRNLRGKRERGSEVEVELRLTAEELTDVIKTFKTLLPPPNIRTELNGYVLARTAPLCEFQATLKTEVADPNGYLRPTVRLTKVEVHEPLDGEVATLYEMGIPVVETGDRYHINVMQKVPLNTDRDNVTPAYLRDLRAEVLNAVSEYLTRDDTSATWINQALESDIVTEEVVEQVLDQRFGLKRVVFDPTDQEANRIALSQGYTVVPGRAFSKEAWGVIRSYDALKPAGQVTPSPKPFHEDGTPLQYVEADTPELQRFVTGIQRLHSKVGLGGLTVSLTRDRDWPFRATYGKATSDMIVNLASVNPSLLCERTFRTVAHEFGHYFGEHLTHEFDDGIATVAARIALLAINEPEFLQSL